MSYESEHITLLDPVIKQDFPVSTENYADILTFFGLNYHRVDFYYQVGKINLVQGWILHLSVVTTEAVALLREIIPVLILEKVAFKIPKDKKTARYILDGYLGSEKVAKVITIYPDTEEKAHALAQQLIERTKAFRGPSIPTDIHLGGRVYTRYGGLNPVIIPGDNGQEHPHIYDPEGKLVKDPYSIPFQLPIGRNWPFTDLASPIVPKTKKIWKHIYKPTSILKSDARGNVYKALYLKSLIHVIPCVIKQGKGYMLSDDNGRDINDRLIWQQELHQKMAGIVPLPKIYDLFEENGDMYLVMEFIKGVSLFDRIYEINLNIKTWPQLPISDRFRLLDYLFRILSIIDTLHQKGFIHRDIAPGNFMIGPKNQLYLIDTELSYSFHTESLYPPFEFGTPGFMSPEQQAVRVPTVKEDIYGLGALMIVLFTGLSPVKFNTEDPESLLAALGFFIGDRVIAGLVTQCLDQDPDGRPGIRQILSGLESYRDGSGLKDSMSQSGSPATSLQPAILHTIITEAIKGLNQPPMPVSKNLWMSKTLKDASQLSTEQKDFSPYAGLHTGMGGALYLLARAQRAGFPIHNNRKEYDACWLYIEKNYLSNLKEFSAGLYGGAAGIALTLAEGINSGLLQNNEVNRQKIYACLDLPNSKLDLATGATGQGIAILQCSPYLDQEITQYMLQRIVKGLLDAQQKDGSWILNSEESSKNTEKSISFANGITGITWFLLEYASCCPASDIQKPAIKALDWLVRRTHELTDIFNADVYDKIVYGKEIGDERRGIILTFVKAYEVLKDERYRQMAETALSRYPAFAVNNNYSQDTGMAGMGELYLEAWRVFKNSEWKKRAEQIARVFICTSFRRKEEETCYWLMYETNKPTADLLIGNSGIIHFLMRCLDTRTLGHIILS